MEPEPVAFGSGNVFEDLVVVDPEEHLAKADLVSQIACVVKNRGLSHAQVARVTGILESEVAMLLRGRFRSFNAGDLDRILQRLKVMVT